MSQPRYNKIIFPSSPPPSPPANFNEQNNDLNTLQQQNSELMEQVRYLQDTIQLNENTHKSGKEIHLREIHKLHPQTSSEICDNEYNEYNELKRSYQILLDDNSSLRGEKDKHLAIIAKLERQIEPVSTSTSTSTSGVMLPVLYAELTLPLATGIITNQHQRIIEQHDMMQHMGQQIVDLTNRLVSISQPNQLNKQINGLRYELRKKTLQSKESRKIYKEAKETIAMLQINLSRSNEQIVSLENQEKKSQEQIVSLRDQLKDRIFKEPRKQATKRKAQRSTQLQTLSDYQSQTESMFTFVPGPPPILSTIEHHMHVKEEEDMNTGKSTIRYF